MPNPLSSEEVRVALLYPSSQYGGHLRDALKELGAAVVYEAPSANIDRDALAGSGARVVIVNLGADSDDYIDQVYDVLDAGDYHVVFNDAQVTEQLSGWDHARWARNLAAKILSRPEVAEPPRPPGAEPVPTPVQKSASAVPVADRPGALAADATRTGVERPTVELPIPAEFHAEQPAGADTLDIAALGDFLGPAEPPASPATPVTASAEADFAAELDALFAAADHAAPAPGAEPDIGLPADFDLGELPAAAPTASSADEEIIELRSDDLAVPEADPVEHLQAEFSAVFDQLDAAAAAVPEATDPSFKPAARPPASAEPLLPPEWNLESLEATPSGAPAGDTFGVEKVSAAEYLAPEVEEPSAKQKATLPTTEALHLELVPMEEAVAPQSYQNPAYAREAWLDGSRPPAKAKGSAVLKRVFVLGASIGGPEAVRDFLGGLPAGFPVLFLLAQHMGDEFLELMSAQLRKAVALTVRNPTHGERVGHGEVLVVPTTHRLQVDDEGVITLAHLPEKPPYSPSIDLVLRDVADQFGSQSGAIIFSGMAHDAIEGSKYLKSRGGVVWAQDPDTCVVSSMVDGAREAGVVSFVGSPLELAKKMIAEYGKG